MTTTDRFNAAEFFVDRHVAEGRGSRAVFRCAGGVLTYAELAERVGRAGHVLAGLGVEIENRVVLALDDSPTFAATFWGTLKLGAVAVPLNTVMSADEYAFVLDDSRAKIAVVEDRLLPRLEGLRERCRWLRAVLGVTQLEASMARAPGALAATPTVREDMAYWGYTSGSTGRPKAAVHSHKDFLAAADLVGVGVFGLRPEDLVFSASKMYFAFGLGNSLYFPARVGAASVLVADRLTPERAFEIVTRERPTVFFAVATLYARMLEVPDAERFDLSSLRLCVSSGEALPTAVFDAWGQRFGHELVDVVGSTEALHDFIANRPGAVRRGSSGQVVPGFEARLVDDAGQPVPAGTVGQLLIKGETLAPYYWNRLERTRATMLGEWVRTGDMFRQDADGYFYFAGRSDDMLKVSGMWVSPAEIEGVLVEHPAVVEAGVVGLAGHDGLVHPHAAVVLKAGHLAGDSLVAELQGWVKARTAGYKVPRTIEFVDDLPKTATGKVQRFRLRSASR
ncbi:MAG TPA: benzoate-CoA ligase family protein [Candidatus Acidoferrum sp.]|nr:benzoate-CoA ligase family protein [Candidatus Acidoferrum sp.]